jgi:HSP20 family protein
MSTEPRSIQVAVGRHAAPAPAGAAEPGTTPVLSPWIDIHEGPAGLILEADLPGASEETITILLKDHVLTLQAHAAVGLPEGARPVLEESPGGTFSRSFILSDEVEPDRISAEFQNGVLRLILPRAERAQPRRIEVRPRANSRSESS